ITMPVPADTALLAWTRNPTQALPCQVRFNAIDMPIPGLILLLENAFCVSYAEHFEPDADGRVAYYCQISIVAEKIEKQGTTFDNRWTTKP
ncbi:MAG TPA: type VI secretion system tube protein TssD, partial [Hymenobacter sp.]|nr:type VI secretion system tube protein TssD [Hymenobacter sp.]